jgi:hypothetical protein
MRCGGGSLASTPLKTAAATGLASVCTGLEWGRIKDDAPTPSAMTTTVPANQERTLMTGRRV